MGCIFKDMRMTERMCGGGSGGVYVCFLCENFIQQIGATTLYISSHFDPKQNIDLGFEAASPAKLSGRPLQF